MVYYYIVSTLLDNSEDKTFQQVTSDLKSLGVQFLERFSLEQNKFKLGNIENLMQSSEQALKLEGQIEQLLKKLERSYEEFDKDPSNLKINPKTQKHGNKVTGSEEFLRTFKWDDATHARNNHLQEILKKFQNNITIIDEDLKKKLVQYQDAKSKQQNLQQKDGNYYVQDLNDVITSNKIKAHDFFKSQHFQAVVCIVNKNVEKLFVENYETASDFIVPGSLKKLTKVDADRDGNFLYRLVVMTVDYRGKQVQEESNKKTYLNRTPLEQFFISLKEKFNIVAREFDYEPGYEDKRKEDRSHAKSVFTSSSKELRDNIIQRYGQAYELYIYVKRIRVIAELATRFGVPVGGAPTNCSFILKPPFGKEKKIQQALVKRFAEDLSTAGELYGTKEELEEQEDFFPFIYVPITMY